MTGVMVGGEAAWSASLREALGLPAGTGADERLGNAQELAGLALDTDAEVLVLGPGVEGNLVQATARASSRQGRPRVLVVGPTEDQVLLLSVFASGALAYLPCSSPVDEVADAVRRVSRGEAVVPATVAPALLELLRNRGRGIVLTTADGMVHRLTQREWEVLVLVKQGRTTAEIARTLYVCATTIRTHIAALHHKLGPLTD